MTEKTYICLNNIFNRSENKSCKTGEKIQLNDEIAKILLKKRVIKLDDSEAVTQKTAVNKKDGK
jgi:UTP-glucose-1-phosphate uridylyltransferase